jgi:hypothetical protein
MAILTKAKAGLLGALCDRLEPVLLYLQHACSTLHFWDGEVAFWEMRLKWREKTEKVIVEVASARVHDGIRFVLGIYEQHGFYVADDAGQAIFKHLVKSMADDAGLKALMGELQKFPPSRSATEARIAALDAAIEVHLPRVLEKAFPPGELYRAPEFTSAANDAVPDEIDLSAGFVGEEN